MLTILSAKYSNPDGTAVVAMTKEFASMLITVNKPEKQAALGAWVDAGGVIAAFDPPVVGQKRDVESEIDALKAALVRTGVIVADEVKAEK